MLQILAKKLQQIVGAAASPHARLEPADQSLAGQIREKKLTYLSDRKLASLANTCREIERAELPGLFVETGCALGGSAILIASIKNTRRKFNVYDVFGMIPPPTSEDPAEVHARYRTIAEGKSAGIGGDLYYGYVEDLYDVVKANLAGFGLDAKDHNISLIKGLVQDTLVVEAPVAFAHIDVDWYDPVMTCLTRIGPQLVLGGSIILDDYRDWGGCRKATDEFLRCVPGQFRLDESAGSLKITRVCG